MFDIWVAPNVEIKYGCNTLCVNKFITQYIFCPAVPLLEKCWILFDFCIPPMERVFLRCIPRSFSSYFFSLWVVEQETLLRNRWGGLNRVSGHYCPPSSTKKKLFSSETLLKWLSAFLIYWNKILFEPEILISSFSCI